MYTNQELVTIFEAAVKGLCNNTILRAYGPTTANLVATSGNEILNEVVTSTEVVA